MLRGFSKVVDKCSEEFFKQVSRHTNVTDNWTTFAITPVIFYSDLYLGHSVSSAHFTQWPYMLIMILTCFVSLFSPSRHGRKVLAISLFIHSARAGCGKTVSGVYERSSRLSNGKCQWFVLYAVHCFTSRQVYRLNSTKAIQHPCLGPLVISILSTRPSSSCNLACLCGEMTW